MNYFSFYESPVGKLFLTADGENLTGLYFCGQKYFPENFDGEEKSLPIFDSVKSWLDIYFAGREPNFLPQMKMIGTPFQKSVWDALKKIPYGTTMTYGDVAKKLNSSARAVGGAVGRNPISIIIPCHRVVGANGNLTGYSAGIDTKTKILRLEKGD